MALVSVCIPIYNGRRFLGRALDSLQAQQFTDFEIVVTDDASTDGCADVVRSYDDPRIRLYRNDVRIGIPGNWNMALSKAGGRFIKFLHQDDILYPDCLGMMVEALSKHSRAGLVFGERDLIEHDGLEAKQFHPHLRDCRKILRDRGEIREFNPGRELLAACIRRGGLFSNYIGEPSFVMFDAEIAARVGFFDNRLLQNADYDYWYRCLLVTDAVSIDKPVGAFRLHRGGESSTGLNLAARLRYVWEETVVLDNLIAAAEREGAYDILRLLGRRKRRFVAYRAYALFKHRFGRFQTGG